MNENVIYIDYLNSYLDITSKKLPKLFKKILYKILNFFGYIKSEKNYLKVTCLENDILNERIITNLFKKMQSIYSKTVVAPHLFINNDRFIKILRQKDYEILLGKWLYKYLTCDIINKIAYVQNRKIEEIEITVLTNEDSDINFENIKILAQRCKVLNIITNKIDKYEVLERFLYDEYGIIINISRNKKKAGLYSDIILNLDFNNEELSECRFRINSILVQFTKEKFENKKGITIVFYKLNLPYKYIKLLNKFHNYNEEIFYESMLYYKTSFYDLKKILDKDKIGIRYFIGNNGKIQFYEIKQCIKKT